MKVVLVLLDSLNRHMVGAYGGEEFATPNLDRFAATSVRFTRHYTGSLPCMPARHDVLCGNLDFPWRPWGSIEIWEEPVTALLRREDVTTMLVTDHPHLFEAGGENYHTDFTAWDYERGHESDPWKTRPDPSWLGAPSFGRGITHYDHSRGHWKEEHEFPGPRTMQAAADWLTHDSPHHDDWLLFVDEFDPHEPFDTPEPYASMYDDRWTGPHLVWPPYEVGAKEKGVLTDEQARQVRAQYGGKLTMIDAWFGTLLDAVPPEAAVVLCTDHGHYLGEKDVWGKPGCPVYEPLGRIPLMVRWPGVEPGTCDALTTSVDLHATICDAFGVTPTHRTHGRSILPLLRGEATSIRDHALTGVWGREVHLVDGDVKYARGPAGAENLPLSMWSNRWSTMPVGRFPDLKLPKPDHRARLDFVPGSDVPVIRQPFAAGDMVPFWAMTRFTGHHLWRVSDDPTEEHDLAGTRAEAEQADRLRSALMEIEAPTDQLVRLGLA